jgi:hypothetical protein
MNVLRRFAPSMLWALQWGLAAAFCVLGALMMGLPPEEVHRLHLAQGVPEGRMAVAGAFLALSSVALVVPSASTFWPALSPISAVALAAAVAGITSPFLPRFLGLPLPDLALAAGCGVVAVGRGLLFPIRSSWLGHEPSDPLAPQARAGERHRRPAVATR